MEPDIKQLIQEVLEKGHVMSLATVDSGGVWVSDVIYIHDEHFNLYWMSSEHVRHSKAVMENTQVAGSITINGAGQDNSGVQFDGIASKVEEDRYDLTVKHFAKRGKTPPPEGDASLKGRSWYVLKPTKIELINEKLFGFHKQKVEL